MARVSRIVGGCRLLEVIGGGQRSQVWLAADPTSPAVGPAGRRSGARLVAVKLYLDGRMPPADLLRVRHPHVVAVLRLVAEPPAAVLALAPGGSLAALVRARRVLDPGEVATVVSGIAGALLDLHGRGIVHGDVTPGNILFGDDGRPLLGDLSDARLVGVGHVVATPGFAAPEVLDGGPPTAAADVHGLAAAAWTALTGRPVDQASHRVPLSMLAPGVSPGLAAAVTAGLDPDPARRPTLPDLAQAAAQAGGAEPVRLLPGLVPGLPVAEAVTHRMPGRRLAEQQPAREPGRHPRRLPRRVLRGAALSGLIVTGLVVGAAVAASATGAAVDAPTPNDPDAGHAAAAPAPLATVAVPAVPLTQVAVADPVAVLRGLVEARARSLQAGDAAAVADLYVPGSAAGSADTALVGAVGAVAVDLEVVDPVVVTSTPDSSVVRTRLVTRPGTGGGAPVAGADASVEVRLTRGDDGRWRLAEVRAADV